MVKGTLKLKEIDQSIEKLEGGKKKGKQRKIKTLKKKAIDKALKKEKKSKKKGGSFSKLSTLGDALMEIETKNQEDLHQSHLSKKESQIIQNRDTQRVQAILDHPLFKANPLQAIQQHLQSQFNKN
ncbi:unnamed protein product [Blepharisma stoltei]|uniref:Ribosome biogenesis protein SLX9 n=1 Tax=Blepharisma stoltei TaxID=1481888 RepID=A0AAU9IE71_9CILI|nr:unnamed protein product [Blepharisma stoltei]